jgi:hypothetical protein
MLDLRVRHLICVFSIVGSGLATCAPPQPSGRAEGIPKVWDEDAVRSLELPLAERAFSPVHVSSSQYHAIPVRPIYKSYSIYSPDREPAGYIEGLKGREPVVIDVAAGLRTEADWIRAGEAVFEAPIEYGSPPGPLTLSNVRERSWYENTGVPLTRSGEMPFARYVIRHKGVIEVGNLSCAMCHMRVMPDGTGIRGAQGNFPFDRAIAFNLRARLRSSGDDPAILAQARLTRRFLFAAPWINGGPQDAIERMSLDNIASAHEAIPPGVIARHGTSLLNPVQVPDLIGVENRRYLDHTGLVRHRGIGDLMRYAALNQGMDILARYGDFIPARLFGNGASPFGSDSRYSDVELYALARYLYALRPPPNPNKFDGLARRGREVFVREACGSCHAPPLYTNNKLTPTAGFKVPKRIAEDVLPIPVGTDPRLALASRRGTGFYAVPSLRGLWYRSPLGHSGSVATLEGWFDAARLRDDYIPAGFVGQGAGTSAVKGHEFGLKLSREERRALIAFLRTL